MAVDLSVIKRHLRLQDPADAAELAALDAELTRMRDAAVDHIEQFLGRSVPWTENEVEVLPRSVEQAILIMVGDLFTHRERFVAGISIDKVPVMEELLNPYRVEVGV